MKGAFRFSFGPWNIHEGEDPFGPTVRESASFAAKLKKTLDAHGLVAEFVAPRLG